TRKPNLLKTAENWIKRLDASDTNRNGVHVYHVKYGEARQLARVLNDIFVGGGGSFGTPPQSVAPGGGFGRTPGPDDPPAGQRPLGEREREFWRFVRRRPWRQRRRRRRPRWGRRKDGSGRRRPGSRRRRRPWGRERVRPATNARSTGH